MELDSYEYNPIFLADRLQDDDCWNPLDYSEVEEGSKILGSTDFIRSIKNMSDNLMIEFIGVIAQPQKETIVLGMEVGDDRADMSNDITALTRILSVQERVLNMKTSKEDTHVSTDNWNFCEVTSVVPSAREQSFDYARKTDRNHNLGYIDVAPIRIIIDTGKDDVSHSSTVTGKASLLGAKVTMPRKELRNSLEVSSLLQDGMLRTSRGPEPKYLPRFMGGAGCPPLFNEVENLFLSVKAFHGGGYSRLYGSATEEARYAVGQLDIGRPSVSPLCSMLRRKQEYLHGTYAEKIMIPKHSKFEESMDRLPPPLYEAKEIPNLIRATEHRLVRARLLITRTDAEIEYERTRRINHALFTFDANRALFDLKEHDKYKRARFEMALSANSALQNLMNRTADGSEVKTLLGEGFTFSSHGVQDFMRSHAAWIYHGCKGQIYNGDNLVFPEDIFIRDEVSVERTFKVGGIPLQVRTERGIVQKRTTTKLGLYEISSSMLEWATKKVEHLRMIGDAVGRPIPNQYITPVYSNETEWVADDTLIIARILGSTKDNHEGVSVAIVTDDKRLCKRAADSANIKVYQILTTRAIEAFRRPVWNEHSVITPEELDVLLKGNTYEWYRKPRSVYIDLGSMLAAAKQYSMETSRAGTKMYKRDLIRTGWTPSRTRFATYEKTELTVNRFALIPHFPKGGRKRAPVSDRTSGAANY